MYISKLHYISQELEGRSHADLVEEACKAGADWVQLRVKNKSFEETFSIAKRVKEICSNYQATFIINDHVGIAKELKSDGVHLGKEDMSPLKAREILGSDFIIGATANTFQDLKDHHAAKVDYVGLGPFRYTSTKSNLSPILGIEGYFNILSECKIENIELPIISIGGIIPADVESLMNAGVYGLAVSSFINTAEDKKDAIEMFNSEFNKLIKTKIA